MQQFAELFAERADRNGHISIKDFQILLRSVGKAITKSDMDRIYKIGQNGHYTIGQFMSFLTTEEIATDELYQIFRELDKNGKKLMSRSSEAIMLRKCQNWGTFAKKAFWVLTVSNEPKIWVQMKTVILYARDLTHNFMG